MTIASAVVYKNETYKSWAYQSHRSIQERMEILARIGWNVRRLRAARDLTQEEFANDSGIDRGYVSGVERGVRNPSVLVLKRFADALKVDVAELFDAREASEFAAGKLKVKEGRSPTVR